MRGDCSGTIAADPRLRRTGRGGHGSTDEQLRRQERASLERQREVIEANAHRVLEIDPNVDEGAARRVASWIVEAADAAR